MVGSRRSVVFENGLACSSGGSIKNGFFPPVGECGGSRNFSDPTEYEILRLLLQNAGKVITHRQLLRQVWGPPIKVRCTSCVSTSATGDPRSKQIQPALTIWSPSRELVIVCAWMGVNITPASFQAAPKCNFFTAVKYTPATHPFVA